MKKYAIALLVSSAFASHAFAGSFVNGDFETGDTSGWAVSNAAYRGNVNNAALTPAYVIANQDSVMHSSIVGTSYVDPNVGAALGATVYQGSYAMRVEDTMWGGYASVISQTVTNYTDPNIFFAWKAVLLGAHGVDDAATMKLVLRDETSGVNVISREYNAASTGSGVDSRFSLDANSNYYTKDWQIEQLAIDASLSGHTFTLSVLASDCEPTGHWGYVYLDGFGATNPTVPEPATLALMGLGLAGAAVARRRKSA